MDHGGFYTVLADRNDVDDVPLISRSTVTQGQKLRAVRYASFCDGLTNDRIKR